MIIFFTIAAVALLYILFTSMFGHDHDAGHGDLGHDTDHGDSGHITSIFSPRVIATFLLGFGGAGGIAKYYELNYMYSCLIGVCAGIVLGILMFVLLEFFARQQATSLFDTKVLVGLFGTVQVPIDGYKPGEVAVEYAERYGAYSAWSTNGKSIPKGRRVKVVSTTGSDLTVEEA